MYIENVCICKDDISCDLIDLFALNVEDWVTNECQKTLFTEERFLPKILVELGIYKSLNEIRRNRPDLWITLDKQDFICKLKVAKKRFLWIAVGD